VAVDVQPTVYASMFQKNLTLGAAGSLGDLYAGHNKWMPQLQSKGIALDLTSHVAQNATQMNFSDIFPSVIADAKGIGADGKLWVTMGENGNAKLAQDPNVLNGKVLRVETDGGVPTDNPILSGAATRTAVYTMGNRNPQGLAVQPGTGAMFEVEHGASTHDEINLLAAGKNYGWPLIHHRETRAGLESPLLEYTPDPLGDWARGRHDRLARAELASVGLRP